MLYYMYHCNTAKLESLDLTIPLTSVKILKNSFFPILVSPISSKSSTSHRGNPEGVIPLSIENQCTRTINNNVLTIKFSSKWHLCTYQREPHSPYHLFPLI